MANKFTEEQLENMSDEEFLKLNEDDIQIVEEPVKEEVSETPSDTNQTPEQVDAPEPELEEETSEEIQEEQVSAESEDELPEAEHIEESSSAEEVELEEEEDSEPEPVKGIVVPEGIDQTQVDTALGFYQKITAPIKADGREFQVRSPEDAIRLIQQGVNYSRRMGELKPMKHLNRMLTDHNLNDPQKLSYLIDLSKGNKTAIEKLLKDNNIDTLDLDIESEKKYQANNYAGNTQDNAFRDALDNTMQMPEGQDLIMEVQRDWDEVSKERLKQDPSILGNLTQMRQSGVYSKVVNELEYQRSLGYLTEVPFLQAFDQVGEAMAKNGVFDSTEQPAAKSGNSMAPLQAQPAQNTPLASGPRKVTAPKKAKPNPHLSSTPPSQQQQVQETEPSYDTMSDEDFLKMAPPS